MRVTPIIFRQCGQLISTTISRVFVSTDWAIGRETILAIDPMPADGESMTLTLRGVANVIPFTGEDTVIIKLANEKPDNSQADADEGGEDDTSQGKGKSKGKK